MRWDDIKKDQFWIEVDEEINAAPKNEKVIIGGDLNGHIGQEQNGVERWHGRWSVGMRNAGGQRILDFMTS